VWWTQLVEILADGGHDVHLLISETYNQFEHHDITAHRHRRTAADHVPCDADATSCSIHTSASP